MATNKQKALAKKIIANPSISMKEAMVSVGYSENTAIAPQNVTESIGWMELMEKYLPDDEVLETHKQGLKATKWLTSHTEPDKEIADHPTRLKAVELAYKVKRKTEASVNVQVNVTPILSELKAE
jgi:hypothetical protein